MRHPEEMPGRGLEPLILSEPDPKSGASANFATPACLFMRYLRLFYPSVLDAVLVLVLEENHGIQRNSKQLRNRNH